MQVDPIITVFHGENKKAARKRVITILKWPKKVSSVLQSVVFFSCVALFNKGDGRSFFLQNGCHDNFTFVINTVIDTAKPK